jgi:hypothetical protein
MTVPTNPSQPGAPGIVRLVMPRPATAAVGRICRRDASDEAPVEVDLQERQKEIEAVSKLGEILRPAARSADFHDFLVSEWSQGSKKRTK